MKRDACSCGVPEEVVVSATIDATISVKSVKVAAIRGDDDWIFTAFLPLLQSPVCIALMSTRSSYQLPPHSALAQFKEKRCADSYDTCLEDFTHQVYCSYILLQSYKWQCDCPRD